MTNLVLLCRRHHHLHHDGVLTITTDATGAPRFARRDGHPIPHHPTDPDPTRNHPADPDAEMTDVTALRTTPTLAHIPDNAATTAWGGEPLDLDYTVAVIAGNRTHRQPGTIARDHAGGTTPKR